jgi:hypothetical protein
MPFPSTRFHVGALLLCLPLAAPLAQEPTQHPPDYPGVRIFIPGVFVTPVPGLPFSGTVEILSKQLLPDGTTYTRRTVNHIARNSDDYWYSEDLKVYLVLKHNDPRTGEQVVGILDVDRKEPDAAMFRIPPEYKVVDETPVEPQAKR